MRQLPFPHSITRLLPALLLPALLLAAAVAVTWSWPAEAQSAQRKPAPKGALLYFHYPIDGIRVPQRFTVRMGLKEMGVAPAGIDRQNTGHHHLLIDTDPPPFDQPIPADYNHIHLGNGQTEVVVTLPPGRHTLQLLMGDHNHVPHNPPVISQKITVYVRQSGG